MRCSNADIAQLIALVYAKARDTETLARLAEVDPKTVRGWMCDLKLAGLVRVSRPETGRAGQRPEVWEWVR